MRDHIHSTTHTFSLSITHTLSLSLSLSQFLPSPTIQITQNTPKNHLIFFNVLLCSYKRAYLTAYFSSFSVVLFAYVYVCVCASVCHGCQTIVIVSYSYRMPTKHIVLVSCIQNRRTSTMHTSTPNHPTTRPISCSVDCHCDFVVIRVQVPSYVDCSRCHLFSSVLYSIPNK